MYRVIAYRPTAGVGWVGDTREVGPFESRTRAEEAAANLVTDPRRWAVIKIETTPTEEEAS